MVKGKKIPAHLSESYINQINVLKALCGGTPPANRPRTLEITEIAEMSGLSDEKEAQRYLYILEGHKLVSPSPPGDFTSRAWHVTEEGIKAFKIISDGSAAA